MKAGPEHRIPLSEPVVRLLKSLRSQAGSPDLDDRMFNGERKGESLSDMTLLEVVRRMNEVQDQPVWVDVYGDPVVPHGFRSTFRDWAGESTLHAREVIERALAHQIPDWAGASYARGEWFDKRRVLMEDWGRWCVQR